MRSANVMNTKSANSTISEDTGEDLVLGLPRLKPGQGCSIMALKGCLAGRGPNPPNTPEEMEEAAAEGAVERYMASFA